MSAPSRGPRHFLDLADFDTATLNLLIAAARGRKERRGKRPTAAPDDDAPLKDRTLALVFAQPSTRTRISFDLAMQQLGGRSMMLTGTEMQLGRGETVGDTARVLSRYVDAVMIRTLDHEMLLDMAASSRVPVINGLTKVSHPCQILADVMTFEEKRGPIAGRTVAWTGDSNNVMTSWIHAAAKFRFRLRVATPADLAPRESLRDWAHANGDVSFTADPDAAVAGADAVVTDCWVSMGDEEEETKRLHTLTRYQVNARLMARAAKDAVFMHCLPAHRGQEVTDEIIDGPQSIVWDEAENRLHAQKAILEWCLKS